MILTQLIPLFQLNGDYFRSEVFFGLSFYACFIGWRLWKKLHWSVGVSFTYFCFSSIYVFTNPIGPYQVEFGHGMTAHMLNAATSFIFLLLFATMVGMARRKWIESLSRAFALGVLGNSLYVILQWFAGNPAFYRGGLLTNASMNGCLIAVGLPLLLNQRAKVYDPYGIRDLLAFGMPILAVFLSGSTMPILTLCVVIATWMLSVSHVKSKYPVALCGVGLLVLIGQYTVGDSMWSGSGRREVLFAAFHQASKELTSILGPLFGYGLGTMHFRLPWLVDQSGVLAGNPAHWFSLHNDWAQTLLETGAVGFFLCFILFCFAVKKSSHRPWLLASLLGYGFYGLGNFPTHLFFPAFFGALLLRLSFDETPETDRP